MTAPLRIAFIGQKGIPGHWGGVEVCTEAIARRLAARGHDVTAYVRRWYTPADATVEGVTLRALPSVHTKHLDAATHSALAALETLCRAVDVVHFHCIGPSLFSWLPRVRGRRVVATIHALDYQRKKWGPAARCALRAGETLALRVPQRTLVVSRLLQERYRERGFATTYVPNGVEPTAPRAPDRIRSLGLAGGDYLLSLGRWVPSKRLLELARGYVRMPEPRPRLVLAGGGLGGAEYERAVGEAVEGCSDVIQLGTVTGDTKTELLSNAAGFVSLASIEGLPIAVMEAMQQGLPCLVSDIPEHREILGGTGALFEGNCENAESVGRSLERLSRLDGGTRAALGVELRGRVAERYDWDRVTDQLEEIYSSLVRRR